MRPPDSVTAMRHPITGKGQSRRRLGRLLTARPGYFAFCLLALSIVSDVDFRARDPSLSLSGSLDWQIKLELAVWAALLACVGWYLVRRGGSAYLRSTFLRRSLALKLLAAFAALLWISSLYSPTPALSMTRATQWVALVVLAAVTCEAVRSPELLSRFWTYTRRALWIACTAAIMATHFLPKSPSQQAMAFNTDAGVVTTRYTWFGTHPIDTASFIGLAVLTLLGTIFGCSDRWLDRRFGPLLRLVLLGLFSSFLIATKARGTLIATVFAALVLAVLHGRKTRGYSVLALMALAASAMVSLRAAEPFVREYILRHQNTEQLASMTGRTELILEALPLLWERPLFGHGYLAARSLFLDIAWGAGEAHNAFLEVMVSTGIVGVALISFVLLRVLQVQRHLARSRGWAAPFGREAMCIFVFVFIKGLVAEGFAGTVGIEAVALVWVVILADVASRLGSRSRSTKPVDVPAPLGRQLGGKIPNAGEAVAATHP